MVGLKKAVAMDTPLDLEIWKLNSYATYDGVTVTHDESTAGLVETN